VDCNKRIPERARRCEEDEARRAMVRGYSPKGPVPDFLPHVYLDALLAVEPERVTVLR
jgi:hypothetical protein